MRQDPTTAYLKRKYPRPDAKPTPPKKMGHPTPTPPGTGNYLPFGNELPRVDGNRPSDNSDAMEKRIRDRVAAARRGAAQ